MYQPGETMDRNFHVEKTLALGGAGVTYLVKELGPEGKPSGPKIALKLLFASRDHGSYLQRLSTEAQILQQLDHPHIVEYLGFVHRTGHSPYLLTRFEEGGSLLDHMRRVGTLSVKAAARIGRQVCWALEKGHSKNIIHRDLKPENMLLKEVVEREGDPHVRVADFGIAKVQGSLGSGLTRTGAFVGTPQYAAPEQFVGEPATAAADVYSLGAVLVFLMTARPVVKKAHLSAPEDVYLELESKLPASVNRAKDPEDDNRRMNLVLAQAMQFDASMRCSIPQFDRMLEALLDERDPVVEPLASGSGEDVEDPGVSLKSLPPVEIPQPEETTVDPIEPGQEPPGPDEETHEDRSIDMTPSSETQTQDYVPEEEGEATSSGGGFRLGLVVVALLLVGLLGAAGWLGWTWWKVPWTLEGQPIIGGQAPHSLIDVRTDKAKARRQSLKPLLRRELRGYWSTCSKSKRPRKDLFLELVIEPDGKVRWVRPVKNDAPEAHWCVAKKMRFTKLKKWRSLRPIRTRVKVEYEAK